MRVEPDFAPPAPWMQPAKDGPPKGREAERGQRSRPNPGWKQSSEKDPIDYDDGAWM
jgi:hypothetical protein